MVVEEAAASGPGGRGPSERADEGKIARAAMVMVVEGDEALRSMIALVLERHGYRVAAVVLGEAAAGAALRTAPELVVLGVRLPDLDGVEVCRGLRELDGLGEVPVVFVGPAEDAEARARVFGEGMTDYLAQPFSEGELRARVETHLGAHRVRRWLRQRGLELESLAARTALHVASGGVGLEHAAAQLSALLATLPDFVSFKDAEGRYLGCNAPFERLLERRRPEILGRTDAELYDADVAAALERADARAIAAGRPCTCWEWVRDREGNDLLVEVVTSPVHSADGQLLGVLGVARDITQVEAERRRLARSQADLADSQAVAGVGSWRMDLRTGQLEWSVESHRLYGVDPEVAPSVELATSLLHPNDRDAVLAAWEAALEEGRGEIEHRLLVDGQTRWVHARWQVEHDRQGNPARAVGTMLDITERKTSERRLAAEQARLHDAVEAAQAATWQWQWQDPAGEVAVDDRWERLLGYGPGELGRLSSMAWAELVHPDDTAAARRAWAQLLAGTRGRYEAEYRLRHRDGRWVWLRDLGRVLVRGGTGQPVHVWGLALDISAGKAQQELIDFVAQHDELTGLFNRERFTRQLRDELLAAEEDGSSLTLACLDLDALAALNDVHGRTAGNEALVAVADRLLGLVDDRRCVGRVDGDEFAVLLRDDAPRPDVEQRLEELRMLVEQPLAIAGARLAVTGSIGATVYPQGAKVDAEQLLRQAEQAVYRAKLAGKNRYHLFDVDADEWHRARYGRIDAVRVALERGEFVLHYQPQVNMRTGEVLGVEALIRWAHPERGLLPPSAFLPDLDGHPLTIAIGDWVIDEALSQVAAWTARGLVFAVNVNVDTLQLHDPGFLERLEGQLARQPSIAAERLNLEVLETGALVDLDHVSRLSRRLSELGVGLALDDFGTGYSSLALLKELSARIVKIDRSFVLDLLDDPEHAVIVTSIIDLGRNFDRQVFAEGVETVPHGQLLLELGCELAQGYAIARPMPPERLPDWMASWQPPPAWQAAAPATQERMSALVAELAHDAWRNSLKAYARGQRAQPPELDPAACRLGRWIRRREAQLAANPLASVRAAHEAAHEGARRLVAAQQAGDRDAAAAALNAVEAASDDLDRALADWRRDLTT